MNKKAFMAALLLIVLLSSIAFIYIKPVIAQSPKTITVPDDFTTIQAAIDASTDNGIVFVKSGNYNEDLVINKPLQLVGQNQSSTIVIGQGNTVCLIEHDNVNVTGFTFTRNIAVQWYHNDIHLLSASNCNIYGNTLYNATRGLWMYVAAYDKIYNNTFIGDGIEMWESKTNNVTGNVIVNGTDDGIVLYFSEHNLIIDNYLVSNRYGIQEGSVNSNDNIIRNNMIQKNYIGILVTRSDTADNFNESQISENDMVDNTVGIQLEPDNIIISCNNITGSKVGICFVGSQGDTIVRNTIQGIDYAVTTDTPANQQGAIPAFTNPSHIYQNNINGSILLSDKRYIPYCIWDKDNVGNYWSDYQSKYPNASQLDDSGLWSSPYVIDGNNVDHYPLVNQVDINSPAPTPTPTPSPSLNPNLTETPNPSPTIPEFPLTAIAITFLTATILVGIVYFKKRKK